MSLRFSNNSTPINEPDLREIYRAAQLYKDNLANKGIVIFFENGDSSISFEKIEFSAKRFSHLVGIERNRNDGIDALTFYDKALNEELIPYEDFVFSNEELRGRADFDLKMDVIESVFRLHKQPLEIGEFDSTAFINLEANKVIGRNHSCLAIGIDDMDFYPISVVNRDFRACVYNKTICPVFATATYDLDKPEDLTITYLSKAITRNNRVNKIQAQLRKITDIDNVKFEVKQDQIDSFVKDSYLVTIDYGTNNNGEHIYDAAIVTRDFKEAQAAFKSCKDELIEDYYTIDGALSYSDARCSISHIDGDVITRTKEHLGNVFDKVITSFDYDDYEEEILKASFDEAEALSELENHDLEENPVVKDGR